MCASECWLGIELPDNFFIFFSLEAALRGLLGALTSTPYSPTQHLEREQALAKQFAEILHFTLRFDELKVESADILFMKTTFFFH